MSKTKRNPQLNPLQLQALFSVPAMNLTVNCNRLKNKLRPNSPSCNFSLHLNYVINMEEVLLWNAGNNTVCCTATLLLFTCSKGKHLTYIIINVLYRQQQMSLHQKAVPCFLLCMGRKLVNLSLLETFYRQLQTGICLISCYWISS